MRKILTGLAGFLVIAVIGLFVFRGALFDLLEGIVTTDMFVAEDVDSFDPGLLVGATFPPIRALHQGREIDGIDEFILDRGAILIANRSVDWRPYCRVQLGQLQDHIGAYEDAAIGIVAITYDSPELQQRFIDAGSITYPLISDIDAQTMQALGILNEAYEPGDSAYGIPHPGVFVVNPDREIVGKLFVEAYQTRVDAERTLAYALSVLQ